MTNSNKKRSGGLISNAFGVAKKLSETGLSVMNHVAPGTVSKLTQNPQQDTVIQGMAKEKNNFERKKYENPQQMMREHLPTVTGKLLGKHYKKINNVASFISPDLNEKLSDYIFDKLNDFVSELTSVDALLKEVGAKDLSELAKDPERSLRISTALANQNKIIAVIQGAFSGAVGGVGAIIDVPTSLALALRSIYHTGRAYGFELNIKDQEIVEYIFKQIDLGTVAEKQALLAAIRTFVGVLETHNVTQLQQLLGSGNDIEALKRWIANEDGSFKLSWMNSIPRFTLLTKLTPLLTMGVSATYSWKLVDDATDKAEIVFSGARQYILAHPNEKIDALEAYEKSAQTITEQKPISFKDMAVETEEQDQKLTQVADADKADIHTPVEEIEQLNKVELNTQSDMHAAEQIVEKEPPSPVISKTNLTSEKPKNTVQQADSDHEVVEKAGSVTKTSTSTKTVTKKRTSAKARTVSEKTVKNSDKSLENKENSSD